MAENLIHYLKGDATSPQAHGTKIIAHVCNDLGAWGKGFPMLLSKRWSLPEQEYRKWHRDRSNNNFAMGAVQFVQVGSYIHVANMIAQQGIRASSEGPPIRYEALEQSLAQLGDRAKIMDASVHITRIGTGLAGGKWDIIEPMILKSLAAQNIPIYVYDYQ